MSKTPKDKKTTKDKKDKSAKRSGKQKPEKGKDSIGEASLPVRRYQSAGGVVIHQGRMLLLDRPGRDEVRLPKGHIEDDEIPADTAVRETAEESGYGDLSIQADLGSQVVEFDYNGFHYVRTEYYFLMALRTQERGDQPDGDLAQFTPIWVELDEAVERLTFPAERTVARRAVALYRADVTAE